MCLEKKVVLLSKLLLPSVFRVPIHSMSLLCQSRRVLKIRRGRRKSIQNINGKSMTIYLGSLCPTQHHVATRYGISRVLSNADCSKIAAELKGCRKKLKRQDWVIQRLKSLVTAEKLLNEYSQILVAEFLTWSEAIPSISNSLLGKPCAAANVTTLY